MIFTKYGPGPETITHKENGLLCDVYQPEDIAAQMLWCIHHPEKATHLGKAARKHIQTHFDKNRILEQNIAFYQSL